MSRLPASKRREQLLDKAAELFAKNGYARATTAQLAKAAGVTEPTLFAQPMAGANQKFSFHRLLGDANGDGAINAMDVSMMRRGFNRSAGDTGFLDDLDLNSDGRVDAADLRLLRAGLAMRPSLRSGI